MNLADVKVFQQELARQIEELNMETNMAEGSGGSQIGDTLRTLLRTGRISCETYRKVSRENAIRILGA